MEWSMTLWDIGRCLQDGFQMLTPDQKFRRVKISPRLLLLCQQDNGDEDTSYICVRPGGDYRAKDNLFDNLITGKETWVHLNTPQIKRDSMTWKYPSRSNCRGPQLKGWLLCSGMRKV
ncbi:hypothetical protein ElyMa_002649400 [Elysia marginata]|uniref:Uncharacterized protein n=1 Tax=Elysia marginata TaxID=1093978 RepID=A0AAV4H7E6_9GAST|nr:hypothetical protein ElyMa_002649400 [Elysia marginata]